METITAVADMQTWTKHHRGQGRRIGFVPTMGFLHEGHLSLMRRARAENDLVVVSIFVNPAQFGPSEDLNRYPRDLEGDAAKCGDTGVDLLFVPQASEVYPDGFQTYVDVQRLSERLCGASRPGHFQGVATVVLKLFNMVMPNAAYFGEKDYQQLQVIRRVVRDLNLDVTIVPCPIVREADGLAMSSRNSYLSPVERKQAVCLHESLMDARRLFEAGATDPQRFVETMSTRLGAAPNAQPDYISLVDLETLEPLAVVENQALVALAVRMGRTRLIDNTVLRR